MKVLMYLLTAVFGLFGVLSAIRFFEVLLLGGGILPVQIFIAAVFLGIAYFCLKKARNPSSPVKK